MSCTSLKRTLEPEDEDKPDTKRKMAARWPESCSTYSWQKQTVLQLSLQKLCHVPSLGRRVLIVNTLRLIQEDIGHQGMPGPSPTAEASQKFYQHQALDVSLTPARVLEQDCEPSFSPDSSPKDEFASMLAVIAAPSTRSSSTEPDANRIKKQTPLQSIRFEPHLNFTQSAISHTPLPINPTFPSSYPAFLPDLMLDDFLFSDLDNFLCDLNPCTLSRGPSPDSQAKVVSMGTEDLVRSLTNQPFKTDLNELEHIMEVLVGS